MTCIFLCLIEFVGRLPLAWVRALGGVLGYVLYAVVASRRKVVQTNLRLCFPELTAQEREALARESFVYFAQAWLDRGWLWFAPKQVLQKRLRWVGDVSQLEQGHATVLFAPHFVGLDAGWTALTLSLPGPWMTIYTDQANAHANAWILRGRKRFGQARLFGRADGVKPIVAGFKAGASLYLLPDMNFGPHESLFVPFFGVSAATVPSLSRFSKLGRARVIPVISRMTAHGYDIEVLPAWSQFPTDNLQADTERMNQELERLIRTMPAQYYWVHKRFKDRPEGSPSVY
jgi:Kdo2-lipid IVA lauroyltransferase/acyltransferase